MAVHPGTSGPSIGDAPAWVPTEGLRRAITVIVVGLVAAIVLGRVDVAVLVAPFALGTAWALRTRPRRPPEVSLTTDDVAVVESQDFTVDVTVGNPDDTAYDLALIRTRYAQWLRVVEGDQTIATPVGGGETTIVTLDGDALRWGWQRFGPAELQVIACDGLLQSTPIRSNALALRVFPRTDQFDAVDAMPKAAGLVGAHRSRRYGDGGELAGIRQFTPGDRLRRIDWRTSLRTRELHVAQTLSDRDAEVVLLLDILHEAGTSGGIEGTASVLDTTVRASAGIAQHYLNRGDRVVMLEYGGRSRALRSGSGRRHYLALLEWLLAVREGVGVYDPIARLFGQHLIPSNALTVVLTPLLEERSVAMLARLARSGRSVVAVDTLPAEVDAPTEGRWSDVAFRLWKLQRRNTVDQLLEHGVPTVTWAGAGTLDLVLRDVARMAAAPR